MVDLPSHSKFSTRNTPTSQSTAWEVYKRLLAYAWHYKFRLVLSIVFAVLIAASFTSMIVGVGTVAKLSLYGADEELIEGQDLKPDPAIEMAQDIRDATENMEKRIGWAPENLDTRFLELVDRMRADPMRAVSIACAIVGALAVFLFLARFVQEYYAGSIGSLISTELAEKMYENVVVQPIEFFEKQPKGEILARFTNDVFMVNRGLTGVLVRLVREPIIALAFFLMALREDVGLTLIGMCVLPPAAYVILRIGKKLRKNVRRSLQKVASMTSVINETVSGIYVVKGFSMEDYETGRVKQEVAKLRRLLLKIAKADAAVKPITEFVLVIGVLAFVLFSAKRVTSGQMTVESLANLYLFLALMFEPIRKLSSVNNLVQRSVASAQRCFEFVDLVPSVEESPDAKVLPRLENKLEFDNVHFSYNGKAKVLRGISFEINKGEMVALVGFSGGGKSTVAKLIPRFYDVADGSIRIDGADIKEATFKSLRGQISFVTQETILFDETVRNNIVFGKASFSEKRVQEAARAANATEFIEKLEHGYDTSIGESGSMLSGGQRQRIAIARALIKDPAILILDEATSNLDSESEKAIQQAIDEFVVGRTTLVIAHRLSTVRRADRILVVDSGQIVEQGTHDELLQRGGIYKRLHDTQFAKEA